MSDKEKFVRDVITVANTTELVKKTIAKVGMEFLAPLSESIQDEKISKAILANTRGAAQ